MPSRIPTIFFFNQRVRARRSDIIVTPLQQADELAFRIASYCARFIENSQPYSAPGRLGGSLVPVPRPLAAWSRVDRCPLRKQKTTLIRRRTENAAGPDVAVVRRFPAIPRSFAWDPPPPLSTLLVNILFTTGGKRTTGSSGRGAILRSRRAPECARNAAFSAVFRSRLRGRLACNPSRERGASEFLRSVPSPSSAASKTRLLRCSDDPRDSGVLLGPLSQSSSALVHPPPTSERDRSKSRTRKAALAHATRTSYKGESAV